VWESWKLQHDKELGGKSVIVVAGSGSSTALAKVEASVYALDLEVKGEHYCKGILSPRFPISPATPLVPRSRQPNLTVGHI
jgi:hypothetical protein